MSASERLLKAAEDGRLEGVQRALADGADMHAADWVSKEYSIAMSSCVHDRLTYNGQHDGNHIISINHDDLLLIDSGRIVICVGPLFSSCALIYFI